MWRHRRAPCPRRPGRGWGGVRVRHEPRRRPRVPLPSPHPGRPRAVGPSARCPSLLSRSLDAGEGCLDEIAEHLLWERDFLEELSFADLDPIQAESFKKRARIDDDYFSTPPLLVRDEGYQEADLFLRRIAGCPELIDPWEEKGRTEGPMG